MMYGHFINLALILTELVPKPYYAAKGVPLATKANSLKNVVISGSLVRMSDSMCLWW
ncbi:hypothetical protein BH09BAC1_BH09BAC1_02440 [soil metagenome]